MASSGDESGGWWNEARREARRLRFALLAEKNDETGLLAWAVGAARLSVRRRPVGDALLCGAHAVLDHETETIWIRADVSPGEYRLFVAHELAHFFLHGGAPHGEAVTGGVSGGDLWQTGCFVGENDFSTPDDGLVIVGYGPAQRRETEANVWAREFLLPAHVAHASFMGGMTAWQIARRAALPLSVVYAQLALGLTSHGRTEALQEAPITYAKLASPTPLLTLDDSQRRAATQKEGPTLTHAGPGTGKTRTLTARVLFLTEEQSVRPENILILTFARKAAGELRERIALYAPQTARRVFISTFHAYGYDLLRRFSEAAGLPPRPLLIEKADAFALMERHLAACDLQVLRYLHDPAYPLRDLLSVINQAKEEGVGPEELSERAKQSGDPKHEEAARVFASYEAALQAYGAVDYSDLVGRAVRLLQTNPDVQNAERAQWQHVLVDEYQDVNRGGAHLLQALTGDGRGLWAVGDVRQAIYQFRGASPANVARFDHDFPGGTRTDLAVNYRSAPPIVGLIGTACGEGAKTWQAARPASEPENAPLAHAILAVAGDERAQWDGIARKMRQFMAAGYKPGDIAVLCRTNNQAKEANAMLAVRGVPVASAGGWEENGAGGILAPPDAKKLLALLSRACEPDGPARNHFPEISNETLAAIGGETGVSDAYDFLADALWGTLGWARTLKSPAVAVALLNLARSFRDRAGLIMGGSTSDETAGANEVSNAQRRAFLNHLRRMATVGSPSLALPDVPNAGVSESTDEPAAVATVRVMTVHAAKGLEFPLVFVPNLSAGKFPSRPGPSLIPPVPSPPSADALSDENPAETSVDPEEARLFFVALSRAQNVLVVTRAEKYNHRKAQPSPLLACLETAQNAGLLHREAWPAVTAQIANGEPSPDDKTLAETPPPVTVEAWELDLYLRCPRRYYFERVAGLAPRTDTSPYQAFKRVVDTALGAANARDAHALLSDGWEKNELLTRHSYAPLYRDAAQKILSRHHGQNGDPSAALPQPVPIVIEREHGDIVVRAAPLASGGLECRTFRKAPSRSSGSPDVELRHVLAQEAAPANAPPLSVRYLQTGDVLPATPSATVRKQNLARADRALQGIRLRVFSPDPAKPDECPACPYFFVCP